MLLPHPPPPLLCLRLLYVVVAAGSSLPPFLLGVKGVVRAPYFVKGQTNMSQWLTTIRWVGL